MRIDELIWKDMKSGLTKEMDPVEELSEITDEIRSLHKELRTLRVTASEKLRKGDSEGHAKAVEQVHIVFGKIKSLIDKKNEVQQSLQSYANILSNQGFSVIGKGMFGTVYGNDKYVAKIFKESDECFLEFINYAKARKGNPFLPRFSKVNSVYDENYGPSYLVFSERLTTPSKRDRTLLSDVSLLIDLKKDHIERGDAAGDIVINIEEKWPGVVQVLVDLQKHFSKLETNCFWDTHGGNFMLRGDQLVITDPYAS